MFNLMNTFLYIVTIIVIICCLNQKLCSAQGNNNSSGNDPCDTSGRCGAFGICDSLSSPICSCLQGFDPVSSQEWSSGNWTSGCERRVPLVCETSNGTSSSSNGTSNSSTTDGFFNLEMFEITGYTDRWVGPESECEGRCLTNCSCVAYEYVLPQACLLWTGNLIDIRRNPSETGSLRFRVARSELIVAGTNRTNNRTMIIIIVIVVGVIGSVCGYLCWRWMNRRRGQRSSSIDENVCTLDDSVDDTAVRDALNRVNMLEFPLFKMEVLENATNYFSKASELGKGGFGPVYKGVLPNGKEIAVKRLSKVSGQGLQEFMNEVELISKLQHRNLVRLLGCCVENKEKMLIYEYMANKSLDAFIFDPLDRTLDWRKRFNIIEGICRGLLYLHRDSRLRIIHRDLKLSNVLLDYDWNPKISDFGMARIYETNHDHVVTARVVGTYGYMSPEYALEGRFSEKSDVFSFGVMMLEIATGRRNTQFFHGEDSLVNLLGHVWKLWNEDNVASLIDTRISSNPNNQAEVMRCMHIGLLCVQALPKDRPWISSVLSMLISETSELPKPKQPASSVKFSHRDTGSSSGQQGRKSSSSTNNVTLTILDGR